ncbi:ATP-binding cassette domain-containing protein [Blautia marasmi]|uniref:ATP-binding cassette domain-containing protein n=1 Tax=Blautia marasmi TaxID=1917868 RepID=UPI00266D655D|nr:ABC transporter ATP-binding protein [Blautia marasmi]
MKEIIQLEKISKEYGHKRIINQIDLSIYEGQSIAFTGHNGSGKSTMLKIIAGLVKPSGGRVVYRDRLLFHYVPERFPKMSLTAWQYLKRMGEIDGIPRKVLEDRCENLFEDFFLTEMVNTSMKDLSKGTLQKIGVIQALLRKPQVLLLDEPLSGQDMDSQMVFIEKMNALRAENVTLLMSCHEQYLMESISDTVLSVGEGKVEKVDITAAFSGRECILWFEKQKNATMPEKYRPYIRQTGEGCRARIPEDESSQMIMEMIRCGWKLRGMRDAGI